MAKTDTKTVRVKFKSKDGKSFTKNMPSVNAALLEEGGKDLAQTAVDTIIAKQPFDIKIEECTGMDIVERSVRNIL